MAGRAPGGTLRGSDSAGRARGVRRQGQTGTGLGAPAPYLAGRLCGEELGLRSATTASIIWKARRWGWFSSTLLTSSDTERWRLSDEPRGLSRAEGRVRHYALSRGL